MHGLVAFTAEVQNRQTTMAQRQGRMFIRPRPLIIRPAMLQDGSHAQGDLFQCGLPAATGRSRKSSNATHNEFEVLSGFAVRCDIHPRRGLAPAVSPTTPRV